MASDLISLADALEFVVDNRGKTVPIEDSGIALIATNCVSNDNLYPEHINVRYVSNEIYNNWFRSHPKPNDILLTNKGSKNGAICLVPDPVNFCIAQDMVALRADESKIDPAYLFAALRSQSIQSQIKQLNVDSVIPHFKKTDFDKLYIPLLSKDIQQHIGEIYLTFSKKIELNRQMNETLEAMAQALFKSWFVDFDPVIDNALAVGNTIPDEFIERAEQRKTIEKKDNSDIQGLFPDAFEFTEEMGWIPRGWTISNVGTEFNTVGGGTPSTKNPDFWENGSISWTTPKDLSGNKSKILLHTDRKITELGLSKISSGILPINTVLMSSRAPVGYLALAKVPVAINQGYIALKCEKTLTPEFAIQWADSIMDEIKQRAGGTTFAEISKTNFRGIPVFVPNKMIVDSYSENVKDLYNQVTSRIENINTLAKLRDTLLPKLMSGELRIPDAVALVDDVL